MTMRVSNHSRLMPIVGMVASLSLSVALVTAAPPTLTIAPPTAAVPGQSLAVTVTPSGTFTQVVLLCEGALGSSNILTVTPNTATPYKLSLPIPASLSPGIYSLTALGVSTAGNATSPAVNIDVERTDSPVQISVLPESLYLPVGQRAPLRVVGTYADGTHLDITHSSNTSFSSSGTSMATVDSQGYVTAVAPIEPPPFGGPVRITVNNSIAVPVVVPPTLNIAPDWPILYASKQTQFSVFAPGFAPVPVRWSISPSVGTISSSGLYTAPKQIAPGGSSVTVTATLNNNPSVSISTGAALYPPVAISISPSPTATVQAGQTQRFSQDVSNAVDNKVDWSISPKTLGAIDNTGLYTAPAKVTKSEAVVITATAIADQTKSASTTVH
jgi:hypothetical protein